MTSIVVVEYSNYTPKLYVTGVFVDVVLDHDTRVVYVPDKDKVFVFS